MLEEDTAESAANPSNQHAQSQDPLQDVHKGSNLSKEQTEKLETLLSKNAYVFESEGNQGLTETIQHKIDVTSSNPINCPPSQLPLRCIKDVNREKETLYREGKIEPSYSPWAFPIVPVQKKDGTITTRSKHVKNHVK